MVLPIFDRRILLAACSCAAVAFIVKMFSLSRFRNTPTEEEREDRNENRHSANHDVCPICLSSHVLAIETNCGHKFCGTCMKDYLSWTTGGFSLFNGPTSCPICRQDINILLPSFTQEEASSVELENERQDVERAIHEHNRRFGRGPRTLLSYIRDCPVLIRHMFTDFFTFGGLVWMFKLRVILCCLGAVVYLFNPLDIIPEAMFGIFGFLDDIIVFLLCIIYVSAIYRRVVINRATANT